MDIESAARTLGLSNQRGLLNKATELSRLFDLQCGLLKGVLAQCKHFAALEIAAKSLKMEFNHVEAVRKSGCTSSKYRKVFDQFAREFATLIEPVSAAELCLKFGYDAHLGNAAEHILHAFRQKYCDGLNIEQKKAILANQAMLVGASFLVVVEHLKIRLGATKIADCVQCEPAALSKYAKMIKEVCQDELDEIKTAKSALIRKGRATKPLYTDRKRINPAAIEDRLANKKPYDASRRQIGFY